MANHRGTVERPTNDQGDLAGSASPKRSLVLADAGAILASLLVLLVVHPVGSVLTSPYWLDEAWVALSSRAPLAALPTTTASTPLGWTFLVWLLPAHGQIHRLIAYAFLTASVIAGYGFARTLGWPGRVPALLAGLTAAAAVTLLPAQQLRHDLKQYTADAAVALVLLALSARLEPSPESRSAGEAAPAGEAASKRGSPFRAAGLAGAVTVGMLFSHPAALVGVAVLGGPFVVAVLGRRWRRLPGLLVEAAPAVVAMGAVYLLADGAARNRAMVDYWAGYFPRPGELPRYLIERADQLRPAIGLAWPLYLLLFAAGVVTLVRLGRPATAAAVVTLPV
ncbi:MAG: hypothetical protein QOI74_858, partial [Micromonosporaceae bacterium]|nr:hypothetical protein [Micromonosporaceae bacterium]